MRMGSIGVPPVRTGGTPMLPVIIIAGRYGIARRTVKQDWSMPRRAEGCLRCQRAFDVGEAFQTLLYETPEGYGRRDYCLGCPPEESPAPLGRWKTRRPEPSAKKTFAFDRETVLAFFERLSDSDDLRRRQFRFVLALLLWRKKALRLGATDATPTEEVWEFSAPRSGVTYRLVRPELDEDQLEQLSTQLEQLLATGAGELETLPTDATPEDTRA